MKVTNWDIWGARSALQEIVDKPWPVKTAYWLTRLTKECNKHLQIIDEMRVKLVTQYGKQNEDGSISVPEKTPEWARFQSDFNDVLNEEVEIEIDKIVLPDANIDIKPTTLMALDAFVEVAA